MVPSSHSEHTNMSRSRKKKENEILYSSAEKSHTLIAQVVKQAITKKYSGQKVNSNQLT